MATTRNLKIVEDAAQAHLAKFAGHFVGHWSSAACFSFYPGKNLGAYGEGGAVISNDEGLTQKMRLLRDHGSQSKYVHTVAGHNYRLEALQGAILRVKLKYLADWTRKRQERAGLYAKLLEAVPEVSVPRTREGAEPVYHLYVIEADRRDELKEHLAKKGIDTGLHYPIPLHLQEAFSGLGYKQGAFPRAEASATRIVSLPMYPELSEEQIAFVAESIAAFYGRTI
jgi:dTDP-4-amino-4,6-dideoxygalactose transaminase